MAAEKKTQETIQGMVEAGNKGTAVIKTDDGQTFLILGQNMAPMIGKTVKVTGTLSKGKTTRSIIVTSFEEVQDKFTPWIYPLNAYDRCRRSISRHRSLFFVSFSSPNDSPFGKRSTIWPGK